jgi:hypothetical protein
MAVFIGVTEDVISGKVFFVHVLIHKGKLYAGPDAYQKMNSFSTVEGIKLMQVLHRYKIFHDVMFGYKEVDFWKKKALWQYADLY